MRKILILGSLVFGLGLLAFGAAKGAEFVVPQDKQDANLLIGGSEPHRNLYTAGGNVSISAPTQGDLYAAGGMLHLGSDVQEDLVAAGGSITLSGKVGGDARIGGGNVTIESPISGDLLLGGGNIVITNKAAIGGDLIIGGGNVTINAPVSGDLRIGGGNVTINGKISGNVYARIDQKLVFEPQSEVVGKVFLHGRNEAVVKTGAKIADIQFTKMETSPGAKKTAGFLTVAWLLKLVAIFIAAWLFLHFMCRRVTNIVVNATAKPWHNLGIGFVGAIVIPVAVIILFATLLGFYTALVLLLWYGLAMLLTALLTVIFVGSWIIKRITKAGSLQLDWKALALGTIVYMILWLIPFVGGLVAIVLWLVTFGSVLRMFKAEIKNNQEW